MAEPHAPMHPGAAARVRRVPAVRPERLALAAVLIAAAALLLYELRGVLFWFDDWDWVLGRRAWAPAVFLRPHNEHLSIVPVAVFKLLFAGAGITHPLPYRLVLVACDIGLALMVWLYARRRVGEWAALVPVVLLAFLGAGWQVILWPFEIGWLVPLIAGIGALLALDRDDRRGDVAACLLVAVALASSGVGLAVAAAVVVELAWARRRLASAWIAAVPLVLYAVWWLAYRPGNFIVHNVVLTPRFAGEALGGALAALTGLTMDTDQGQSESLGFGRPLAVAAVLGLVWWLVRARALRPRVVTLLAAPLVFWLLTGIARAGFSPADASRYAFVGAVFLLLLAVELAAGLRLPRAAAPWVAAALVVVTVVNVGNLRAGARLLRGQYAQARADLGALAVARDVVPPGYLAHAFPGVPLARIPAATWFAAARDLGSPALTPAELASAPGDEQLVADSELVQAHGAALTAAAGRRSGGPRPAVDAATGGTAAPQGNSCVRFTPAAAALPGGQTALDVTLPARGLALTAGPAPAAVTLRRYSAAFTGRPIGTVAPSATAALRIGPDRDPRPWHLRVSSAAAVTACSLR